MGQPWQRGRGGPVVPRGALAGGPDLLDPQQVRVHGERAAGLARHPRGAEARQLDEGRKVSRSIQLGERPDGGRAEPRACLAGPGKGQSGIGLAAGLGERPQATEASES